MLQARHRPRTRRRDRGSIAVVAAVAMVALIGMAALVVDGGYMALRRRALQGVADAAALAGGFSLPTTATAISQAKTIATARAVRVPVLMRTAAPRNVGTVLV